METVFLLSIAALAITSLLLLLSPVWSLTLLESLGHALERSGLAKSIRWERTFYRHHRGIGLFLVAGSLYSLYELGIQVEIDAIARSMESPIEQWLIQSAWWFLWIVNAFVPGFGLAVVFRPSQLKELEQWANRPSKEILPRHGRRLGAILLLFALYFGATVYLAL